MNILIKLTCLIGLVIAPILGNGHSDTAKKAACCTEMSAECTSMSKEECIAKGCTSTTCKHMNDATTEVKKEMTKEVSIEKVNVDGKVKATITTTSNYGTPTTETFEGTEAEVSAKIEEFKKK